MKYKLVKNRKYLFAKLPVASNHGAFLNTVTLVSLIEPALLVVNRKRIWQS